VLNTDPTGRWTCAIKEYDTYNKYCEDLKTRLDADVSFKAKRMNNALAAFIDMFRWEDLPGGSAVPKDLPRTYGTPATMRLQFVGWYLSRRPEDQLSTDLARQEFSDTGFRPEFRDSHYLDGKSNQVNHFMLAVVLGFDYGIPEWMAIACLIGHEISGLDDIEAQCGYPTIRQVFSFQNAITADSAGDVITRDCLLKEIMPTPVEIPYQVVPLPATNPSHGGRSLQDLRLSLKGYRFGLAINDEEITDLASARSWLGINLGPTHRR
jgi:hypothetical protein